jgi:prefoldin subunit 5
MSNLRPESRIKSLEKRATDIEASIEELAADTAEEFKVLRHDNKLLFDHIQGGFDQAHAFVQEQFDEMRAEMATKNDIARLESLIMQLLQQKPSE